MPTVDEKQLDRETALVQECARLILANEANDQYYARLRNSYTKQAQVMASRNHWKARALAAEALIREALKK